MKQGYSRMDRRGNSRKQRRYHWNGNRRYGFYLYTVYTESTAANREENTYNYRFKPESYFQSVIRWFRENYQLDVKKDWMSNVPGTIGSGSSGYGEIQ